MPPETRQILDMNAYKAGEGEASPLLTRRLANFGAASVLFYEEPVEMVGASGATMLDAAGNRYLDFYNNVPSVGHNHPKVFAAVSAQLSRLNTNTRYLNDGVETYLEALKEKLPPVLSNVVLACSGSEANDLAMRIAMKATGTRGFVVTEAAYHGNTYLVSEASPSAYKKGAPPAHIRLVPAPSVEAYGAEIAAGFASSVAEAARELEASGAGFAALLCDSIFSSDGVFADPPGFLSEAVEAARAAGGLFIADEVQPGFARTGAHFWGFGRHGVEPDIVTMGKPMGNGFPMSAMATRPDLLAAYCEEFGYFNTFGGNPVAAAAGLAVLQVLAEEGLQENAATVGAHLLGELRGLAAADERIADVRGSGLFLGVDLVQEREPDPALASALINGLKARGVLIGAAGRYGHTLKLRPPLCLTREEADLFLAAFSETLASVRR